MPVKTLIKKLLILDEGLRLKPYLCPSGYWTIGIGRNLDKKGLSSKEQVIIFNESGLSNQEILARLKKNGITLEQAYMLLDNDIDYFIDRLTKFDWFLRLSEPRKSVIINIVFNTGLNGFLKFENLIKALENNYYDIAVIEILDSDASRNLVNRYIRLAKIMETDKWPTDINR